MNLVLKLCASCALAAIAVFFVVLSLGVSDLVDRAGGTLEAVQRTAEATAVTIDDLRPAIADARRTILIAGGTLNLARDTMRNEQASIREANEQTIATMRNLNALVAGVGESQKVIAAEVSKTLETVPPVMLQTERDLATLNQTIEEMRPLFANSTATMANAARISGALAKITDAATAPQPWYKRAWGYVWAPVKLAAVFMK